MRNFGAAQVLRHNPNERMWVKLQPTAYLEDSFSRILDQDMTPLFVVFFFAPGFYRENLGNIDVQITLLSRKKAAKSKIMVSIEGTFGEKEYSPRSKPRRESRYSIY